MGTAYRFLAIGGDLQRVYDWFAALPEPPTIVPGREGPILHFAALGPLAHVPGTRTIDSTASPVASLFPPEQHRGILWTAAELHFLPTPLSKRFPPLHAISRRFARWLKGFDRVFETPGKRGEW